MNEQNDLFQVVDNYIKDNSMPEAMEYLGIKINHKMEVNLTESNNPIINILVFYYLSAYYGCKYRPRHDVDSAYIYRDYKKCTTDEEFDEKFAKKLAERGDVMVSFWSPLKRYMEIVGKGTYDKTPQGIIEMMKLVETWEEWDKGDKSSEIHKAFYKFAELCYTRGNILVLPYTKNKNGKMRMNPDRYNCSEDKIDQSIWNCYKKNNGKLSVYFNYDDINVKAWIEKEKLGHVKKIRDEMGFAMNVAEYKYSHMDESNMIAYIEYVNKIIDDRNEEFDKNDYEYELIGKDWS